MIKEVEGKWIGVEIRDPETDREYPVRIGYVSSSINEALRDPDFLELEFLEGHSPELNSANILISAITRWEELSLKGWNAQWPVAWIEAVLGELYKFVIATRIKDYPNSADFRDRKDRYMDLRAARALAEAVHNMLDQVVKEEDDELTDAWRNLHREIEDDSASRLLTEYLSRGDSLRTVWSNRAMTPGALTEMAVLGGSSGLRGWPHWRRSAELFLDLMEEALKLIGFPTDEDVETSLPEDVMGIVRRWLDEEELGPGEEAAIVQYRAVLAGAIPRLTPEHHPARAALLIASAHLLAILEDPLFLGRAMNALVKARIAHEVRSGTKYGQAEAKMNRHFCERIRTAIKPEFDPEGEIRQ